LGYTATHPLGGGFMSYLINHVEVPPGDGEPGFIQFGRAFHSIYFEMLGEQGYPGLAIFLAVAGISFVRLSRTAKKARAYPELQWVVGLSAALQSGLAVFLTSGAFVGIAFQPMFWYFVSMGISLNAYMERVEHQQEHAATGWRAAANGTAGASPPQTPGGWRNRPASLTRKPVPAINAGAPANPSPLLNPGTPRR